MNAKLEKIIRDVAISALIGLFPGGKTDAAIISKTIDEKLSLMSNNDHNISANRPGLTLKYAYNFSTDEGMFHRSHRSHSSHSSHRSHYSSTSGTSTTNPVQNTNTQNAVKKVVNPNQNPNTIKNATTLTLGSRNLKFGMKGDDVLELKKALIKAKCYKVGEYEILDDNFDQKTHDAVNLFKGNKQLAKDGLVDAVVIYHLKND